MNLLGKPRSTQTTRGRFLPGWGVVTPSLAWWPSSSACSEGCRAPGGFIDRSASVNLDQLLKEVGYEDLRRVEVLAAQATPIDRIARATGLSYETVKAVLYGPGEE